MTPPHPSHPYPAEGLRRLIGLDYADGGTDPVRDGGVDCYGAARLALKLFGVEIPETPEEALASAEALAVELTAAEPTEPGDLLEFLGSGETADVHLGVALSRFEVFHATRKLGTVVTSIEVFERGGRLKRRLRMRRSPR